MSAPAIQLRPYQVADLDRLRAAFGAGHRRVLYQLPTGAGKTVTFSAIAAGAISKGKRVLILVHRRELLRQAVEKLAWAGLEAGVIASGMPATPDAPAQVASIQTLARRIDGMSKFDLLVLDEAHHAVAGQWRALIAGQPEAKVLGVTATPMRADGKGLGVAAGGLFDALVTGPSIRTLTADGFLCPARCFAPAGSPDLRGIRRVGGEYAVGQLAAAMDKSGLTGDAVEHYARYADHKPAIAFCVSVQHARHVADQFSAAGYRAVAISGDTPVHERDAAIAGLVTGATEVLCSCDLISEGLDVPAVEAVILLRPTASLGLHMQQIGRGMRPAPGKDALIVLDHAGNCVRHGLPDSEREWSLDGVEVKQRERHGATSATTRRCPECGALSPIEDDDCRECGALRPGVRRVTQADGDLAELKPGQVRLVRHMTYREVMAAFEHGVIGELELREFGRLRGYKAGWAYHVRRDLRARLSVRAAS